MAISFVNSSTNFSSAGTGTPSVAVPSGAAAGDLLVAVLSYAGSIAATSPAGWTEHLNQLMGADGRVVVISRTMQAGVTQAQWTLDTGASYAKNAAAMAVFRGHTGTPVIGTAGTRASSSVDVIAPSVTTDEDAAWILGVFGDRASSQTTLTAPTGMTERAKVLTGGGGGASALIASEARATAGATGTRTATWGVASSNALGVLVEVNPAGSTPPVVDAGADATITAGTAFSRTATATDADGTIASRLWTQISGPTVTLSGSTTATVSFTPAEAGVIVLRHTATDNSGTTAFDDVAVYVTDTTSRPSGTVSNPGNFVPVGGSETLHAALADESDSTYIESPEDTTGAAWTGTITPLASGAVTVTVRAKSSTTPAYGMTTELLQGNTVIATWADTTTTSWADYAHTTTNAEAAAISDYSDLRVRITAS